MQNNIKDEINRVEILLMKKNKKIMRKILFGVAIIYVTFTINKKH